MDCLSISDPRKVPALPVRPSWLAEESMDREADISKAVQGIMTTWNAWTDCVEKVFQHMGNQTADLQISEDEYINFVRMFASHPARPIRRPLEDITEHEYWFIRTMPHRYLTYLHGLWNAYADRLEKTYIGMAAELGRCNLLASPFETASPRGQLHGILRSMLGPGRLFHGLADTRTHEVAAVGEMSLQGRSFTHSDQLVSGLETTGLHGAPVTYMKGAEELVVGLKNMNIEADIS
ncbi:hypothetical protein HO173_002816 [Letharia columbiana]|uniref:Uncharacterized protein n=1 Tax=Letharia columbiana TaxID=112416 RepID=A0A8H6G1W0_9LECA|nr:uncharacterized protein HO173_002816 [Letharia columbiana]KAF6238944.1 hypothetical protein HO173_002816 [Letharia columbiana]